MLEKFKKRTVESAKNVLKEETEKTIDELMPAIVAGVTAILFIFCMKRPPEPKTIQYITINNYYGR